MNYMILPLTIMLCSTANSMLCSTANNYSLPAITPLNKAANANLSSSYEPNSSFLWFPWFNIEKKLDNIIDNVVWDYIDFKWDYAWNLWDYTWNIIDDNLDYAWDIVDEDLDNLDYMWETIDNDWHNAWDIANENIDSFDDIWEASYDTAFNTSIDQHDKAWQAYDDSQIIAGEDVHSQEFYRFYQGGREEGIKCLGAYINGTSSILIVNTSKETEISIESAFELTEGRFKLVHVKPDGSVKRIDNSGLNANHSIILPKGRNVIKLVGQAAKLNRLTVSYHGLSDNDSIISVYYSEQEEFASQIEAQINSGSFDKDKVMNSIFYLDSDVVSNVLNSMLQQEITISKEDLIQLFIFSDSELSCKHLIDAIQNGKMDYFDSEYFSALIPYIDEQFYEDILSTISEEISFTMIDNWKFYLDEETLEHLLIDFLEAGNKLTYSQFYHISPYLDDNTIEKIDNLLKIK